MLTEHTLRGIQDLLLALSATSSPAFDATIRQDTGSVHAIVCTHVQNVRRAIKTITGRHRLAGSPFG
jgi:hypothetical protein